MTEGTFLDLALDQVPELEPVPGNQEYQLKCTSAKIQESKGDKTAGQNLILFRFKIMGEDTAPPVTYPVMLPYADLDKVDNDGRKRQLKRVLEAMDFPADRAFNVDELVGEECWAVLSAEEDPQYGPQNNIKSFVAPK